jgi:hypothetical protein
VPHQTLSTVAILARDMVAGRALELLLQSAGYGTRLMLETAAEELLETLDGVDLLLLAPSLSARHREDFLNLANSRAETTQIPILELVTSSNEAQAGLPHRVPWPCRMEDLHGRIEAALARGCARRAV